MRTARKAIGLGWRAMLALAGGVATLAGCGGDNNVAMYGVQLTCHTDSDCVSQATQGWYCDGKTFTCVYRPDAGSSTTH